MLALFIGCGFFSKEELPQKEKDPPREKKEIISEAPELKSRPNSTMDRSKALAVSKKRIDVAEKDQLGGDELNLDVQFVGLSDLHQRFFLDPQAQAQLKDGLKEGGYDSPWVSVFVEWIAATHGRGSGRIVLIADQVYDLDGLETLARPLKAYRSYVGNYYDVRLLSFSLYLQKGACLFELSNIPDRFEVSAFIHEGLRVEAPVPEERKYFFSQQPQVGLCLSEDQ